MTVPNEINQPSSGHVLVIGRDPGEEEVEKGRPFVGPAGQQLDKLLALAGLRREDVNIVNLVQERPYENNFKAHDVRTVDTALAVLNDVVRQLSPSLVITLGNEAAWALVPDWPSSGRGVFGAKGIEERRGYFWRSPLGPPVLTTLHPASVLYQELPGKPLIEWDFKRVRQWLDGKLPQTVCPPVQPLTWMRMQALQKAELVAWDIETKWDMTSLLCSGFCGEDLVPTVGLYPRDKEAIEITLNSTPAKVGHNGLFDLSFMKLHYGMDLTDTYVDDTQHLWWAIDPELSGQDESESNRMTRKGLAFLASMFLNVPWWKNYPGPEDPLHVEKMVRLNGIDVWVTRQLADILGKMVREQGISWQYRLSIDLIAPLVETHLEGLKVNTALAKKRSYLLEDRSRQAKQLSAAAGAKFAEEYELQQFIVGARCPCCSGIKSVAAHCWRCGGLPGKPTKKMHYASLFLGREEEFKKTKVAQLKASLPACKVCQGTAKLYHYEFNPFSDKQLKTILYDCLRVPRRYFKKKLRTDEFALRSTLKWAKS